MMTPDDIKAYLLKATPQEVAGVIVALHKENPALAEEILAKFKEKAGE